MSQHDYVIANQSGSAFRAELNNALAASVSTNSGSSAPSTTYAYMLWADTTNGVLKIRNSANNAWIELLQLDGTLTMEDGTESSPGLGFRDDLDTGLYSPSANTIAISTGATQRLQLSSGGTIFNEGGADVDFRIEGDSEANLFYVDAGNDRIGIGTNAPSETLDVEGTIECLNELRCKTGNDLKINAGSANRDVFLQVNDVTLMTVKGSTKNIEITDGNLVVADTHGIDFSAVSDGSRSVSSNLLDDYEEGSFTADFWASSTAFSTAPTLNTNHGRYTKIGNQVSFSLYVNWSNNAAGAAGNLYVGGLPFTQGSNSVYSGVYFGWWDLDVAALAANQTLTGYINNNQSYVVLYESMVGAGTGSAVNVNDFMNGKSGNFQMNGTYYVTN